MPALPELPISRSELARFRIDARKRGPAGQVGSHLLRRRGQSLEFRDLGTYTPGDDFRHIDWLASARHGDEHDLLIRQFRAEENLQLVISVDNRPTMAYPPPAPKIAVACWLAFCTAAIAAAGGDRVFLHRLFGRAAAEPVSGRRSEPRAWSFLADLAARPAAEDAGFNLQAIARLLPPASVWLIISDLYLNGVEDDRGVLARAMARAQRGLCWVLLADLDSWPCERVILGLGARRILGPGVAAGELELEVDATSLQATETAITRHKAQLLETVPRTGLSLLHWPWPAESSPDAAALFVDRFTADEHLQRLFRRQG